MERILCACPIFTSRVEDLPMELKKDYTIVTHNMQQVVRISDHCTNIAEWVEFSVTGIRKDCQQDVKCM